MLIQLALVLASDDWTAPPAGRAMLARPSNNQTMQAGKILNLKVTGRFIGSVCTQPGGPWNCAARLSRANIGTTPWMHRKQHPL